MGFCWNLANNRRSVFAMRVFYVLNLSDAKLSAGG